MEETPFYAYLVRKRIDPDLFKSEDPTSFASFEKVFNEVHENSFTAQKLFLINALRRRYNRNVIKEDPEGPKTSKMRPKMIVKAKLK